MGQKGGFRYLVNIRVCAGAGVMTQRLRAFATLVEDLDSAPSTRRLTTACKSGSREPAGWSCREGNRNLCVSHCPLMLSFIG